MTWNATCLLVCCLVILQSSYVFPQLSETFLVAEVNSSVYRLVDQKNFSKIWEMTTGANEFTFNNDNVSIVIAKSTKLNEIKVNDTRIDFPNFSITTTENCTILLHGYKELFEKMNSNRDINSVTQLIIQSQSYEVFETPSFLIGFNADLVKTKSIQKRDPCCLMMLEEDIVVSNDCICDGDLIIETTSGFISIENTVTLIAENIRIIATKDINLSGVFQGSKLILDTQGEVLISETSELQIPQIIIQGSSVTIENFIYDPELINMFMNITGFSEGINFCGPKINNLQLFGTANLEIGVYICQDVLIGENLFINGESTTNKGVVLLNEIYCEYYGSCIIYGESGSDFGIHLNTNNISNVIFYGESNENSGIYIENETVNGEQLYSNIELNGNGNIGVEIILTKNTFFKNSTIIGDSNASTDRFGVKISQTSSVIFSIEKGYFEGINGSIKLPPTISLPSIEENSGLTVKSDFEIYFDDLQNIQISLNGNKLEIINGFLRALNSIEITGNQSSSMIIPNDGFIQGNLIFSLLGTTKIFKGIEVQGIINWNSPSTFVIVELCGSIESLNSITLPENTITTCYNTEYNFLTLSATNNIQIKKLNGNQNNFLQPPVRIISNSIDINKNVSRFLFINYSLYL